MTDRENVIKTLNDALTAKENYPWAKAEMSFDFIRMILSLLKEQEAVKPKYKERMGGFVTGLCPTCGTALNNIHNVKACGKCGQAVKWEESDDNA